jgi:hypothetical protein
MRVEESGKSKRSDEEKVGITPLPARAMRDMRAAEEPRTASVTLHNNPQLLPVLAASSSSLPFPLPRFVLVSPSHLTGQAVQASVGPSRL